MNLLTIVLFLSVEIISAQNICRYPSIANPPLPVIKEHRMPPTGPSRGTPQRGSCPPATRCDLTSCSFSFYRSPYSCDTDCRCVNPCGSKSCYSSQICVVMRAPHNGFAATCVSKPEESRCPRVHCSTGSCLHGNEVDANGCPTCECKNPCKDFGCVKGSVCQMLKLTPGSDQLSPKCVVCPRLVNCHKTGMCREGLKKDSTGCDVCECHECACSTNTTTTSTPGSENTLYVPQDSGFGDANNPCGGSNCADYLQMNVTSGCDLCRCEANPCWYQCGAGESCQKRYTRDGRLYGLCVPSTTSCLSVKCDPTKCPHGLQIDSNGCVKADCTCKNPCDHHECPSKSYCQTRICPSNSGCVPAFCTECPDIQNCGNTCLKGRLTDANGCDTCQCKQTECQEDKLCKSLYCPYGKERSEGTGCEICLCAPSPCENSPCEAGMICSVVVKAGSHVAACNAPSLPPKTCKVVNCGTVDCPLGLEKDDDGCLNPSCKCRDLCKDYKCQEGMRCEVHNGCLDNNPHCRDRYLRACVPINAPGPTTTTTTTTTTITTISKDRGKQGGCTKFEYCASWCKEELDPNTNCVVCNCPAVIDRCLNYECPEGQKCTMTKIDCQDMTNCRDAPMRQCVDIEPTPLATTTPRPVCKMPICTKPCYILTPSPNSNTPCPYCECPSDCQAAQCDAGKVCAMVFQSNCYSSCPKIPRCVDERPAQCLQDKVEGYLCHDIPAKQWYYDHANKRCDFFFYNGCHGNNNRFPSFESCRSSCQEATFDCPPTPTCTVPCPHGFILDSNNCKTCRCVDPCESITCPSANMGCKVHALPCPSDQPSCHPTYLPSCVCRKRAPCDVTCPYGNAKDKGGCNTCECFDPCKNVVCGDEQLCSIAYHESCDGESCNVQAKAQCMDAFMKRNIRIRVNASYEIYIRNNVKDYNSNLRKTLSKHYEVPSSNVYIIKHEKGSIITTADVLIEEKEGVDHSNLKSFELQLDDKKFLASVISQNEEIPTNHQSRTQKDRLSKDAIILIVLLCVLIPVAVIVIILVIFFACKCRDRYNSTSISHQPLSPDPSLYSNSLPKSSPFTTQTSNDLRGDEKEGYKTTEGRIKSFTEA